MGKAGAAGENIAKIRKIGFAEPEALTEANRGAMWTETRKAGFDTIGRELIK